MKNNTQKEGIADKLEDMGVDIGQDLSYINNVKDLEKEIKRIQAKVKVDGYVLKEGFASIPSHTLKASAAQVLPFAFSKTKAGKSYNIGKVALGYLLSKPWKKENRVAAKAEAPNVLGQIMKMAVNEVGIAGAFKLVQSFIKKKKNK